MYNVFGLLVFKSLREFEDEEKDENKEVRE